jgi:ribosome biogenesis protein ERB1
MKIVRAIRQGRIVPSKPKTTSSQQQFYSIWSEPPSTYPPPLPAPKPPLPTNSESYNPPEEYLPTEEEHAEWEATDPEDRARDYLPQKYSSLRLVPAYDRFIKERFSRQLDLYLAPRIQRKKLNIDPNTLIPKLPSPSSLKPFPNYKSLKFTHVRRVRCISVSPDGAWVVSGDEDGVVSFWEIMVGREVKRWKLEGKIGTLEWCPRLDASFFVVGMWVLFFCPAYAPHYLCSENALHFLIPPNLSPAVLDLSMTLLAPASLPPPPAVPSPVKWTTPSTTLSSDDPILTLSLPPSSGLPKQITWHRKGDYMASVCA